MTAKQLVYAGVGFMCEHDPVRSILKNVSVREVISSGSCFEPHQFLGQELITFLDSHGRGFWDDRSDVVCDDWRHVDIDLALDNVFISEFEAALKKVDAVLKTRFHVRQVRLDSVEIDPEVIRSVLVGGCHTLTWQRERDKHSERIPPSIWGEAGINRKQPLEASLFRFG